MHPTTLLMGLWVLPLAACAAGDPPVLIHEGRRIALSFEDYMLRFEQEDAGDFPRGEIVFTGSSSVVRWKTLREDMAPLPVINRAFGGSQASHLWHYADRAILPREPRVIVVYIGDNDLANAEVTVESYLKYVKLFIARVRGRLPGARFIFLSSKPSVRRWNLWPRYVEGNAALQALCEADAMLEYVDITPSLLDENGVVRQDCYGEDTLHFKPEVYAEWTRIIKPVVARVWEEVAGGP